MVMCKDPVTLAPFRGALPPNSILHDISPGISTSASSISFLPQSAKEMSLILESAKYYIFIDFFLYIKFDSYFVKIQKKWLSNIVLK